jgi:hypothetical protein
VETFAVILIMLGTIAYAAYHIHLYVFRHEEYERRQRVKAEMRNERIKGIVGSITRGIFGGLKNKPH